MTTPIIEHVNMVVRDPHRTAALLADLFGWHIRWEGAAQMGGYTVHVGNEQSYLALYTRDGTDTPGAKFLKGQPLNHVGILVDDLEAIERKVEAHGLVPFSHGDYEPGRRFYFLDPDGIEYEVISYAARGKR